MLDPDAQARSARAAMEESLAKQRASVQVQMKALQAQAPDAVPFAFQGRVAATPPACPQMADTEVGRLIGEAARAHDLDPALVREVARQESGFYPCAVSRAGAVGLMQLMPQTSAQLGVKNPFDPEESLQAGAKLLKQLLEQYKGDLSLALGAYNAGAQRVADAGGIPEIPETQSYVKAITERLKTNSTGAGQ